MSFEVVRNALDRLGSAIRNAVTYGQATSASVNGRTLVSAAMFDGEQQDGIVLLMPVGWVGMPKANGDLVVFNMLGHRDQKVAIGGGVAGDTPASLTAGEFGMSDGVRYVLFFSDRIEVSANNLPVKVLAASEVDVTTTGNVNLTVGGQTNINSTGAVAVTAPAFTWNGNEVQVT